MPESTLKEKAIECREEITMDERNLEQEIRNDIPQMDASPINEPTIRRVRPVAQEEPRQTQSGEVPDSDDPYPSINKEGIEELHRVADYLEDMVADAIRMPVVKNLCFIHPNELEDLIGQLKVAIQRSLGQAENIIALEDSIKTEAERTASRAIREANEYKEKTTAEADTYRRNTRKEADEYSQRIRQEAANTANKILEDAHIQAEAIVKSGQTMQQQMVMETEIVRRANAFAIEIRDKAQKDANQIYSQAYIQSDKMLSGAASALSRSSADLASLRDTLLNPNRAPSEDVVGGNTVGKR